MTLINVIREFFQTPAGAAVVALFALAGLNFLLGTFAAIRDGVFQLEAIGAWLRKDIAGKVLPATAVLLIGHMLGGLTFDDGVSGVITPGGIITTIGLGMAATYVLGAIGSLQESLVAKPGTRKVPTE